MSEAKPRFLGNINGWTGRSFAGAVWDKDCVCPTINSMQGGGRQPHIIEVSRGNVPMKPEFERFVYTINDEKYLIRMRKLTPLECWRLMGFTDEDFRKAEAVNSNTQLYKQAGNSIVKQVLESVFAQMLPKKSISDLQKSALDLLSL